MSQQRSCCCGPQQEFELECLHSDKMGSYYPSSNNYDRNDITAHGRPRRDGRQFNSSARALSYKKNTLFDTTGQLDGYRQGQGTNIDTVEKTGMGCMLCQGSMILSFKAKAFNFGGMLTKRADGCVGSQDGGCKSISTYFDGTNRNYPAEEQMHVLYLAAKDFWYFERGPSGVPFSSFNFSIPPNKAEVFLEDIIPVDRNNRLGFRKTPEPASFSDCAKTFPFAPRPTDNDGLCHPELTYCTNPSNVVFGSAESGTIPSRTHIRKALNAGLSWDEGACGRDENRDPEFADYSAASCYVGINTGGQLKDNFVCAQLESNINERASDGFNGPCGGIYAPGFSSWQMYQMRKTPHLRYAADIVSYGNGIRIFPAPGEAIEAPIGGLGPTQFSNCLGSQYGVLYKVRMWVKADQHVNTRFEYPCTDSSGNQVAYYPAETNRKMQTSAVDGGYRNDMKRFSSGPAAILYSCSGVPVFSSDLRDLIQEGESGLSSGNAKILSDYYYGLMNSAADRVIIDPYKKKHFECTKLSSGIEDILGESGKFVAKDWRPDQIQKYDELQSEFQLKAAETIAELGDNLSPKDLVRLTKYTSIQLPESFKSRLTSSSENELLPVQKSGPEFLTMFIHRVAPKQLGSDEGFGEDILITEMPKFQASNFSGDEFAIDYYDPWHPNNNGSKWPNLGTDRQDLYPIQLTSPDGRQDSNMIFKFRYPVRAAYASAFLLNGGELTDEIWDEIAPKWERDLFEIWYKKNPVYFHAVPGGWAWSGDGVNHQPGLSCEPDAPCFPSTNTCRWSNTLRKTSLIDSVHQLRLFSSDAFPNTTQLIELNGASFISQGLQLRNKPYRRTCSLLPGPCAYPGIINRTFSAFDCGSAADTNEDCDIRSGRVSVVSVLGNNCSPGQFAPCTIGNGASPDPTIRMINCCRTPRSFYSGTRKGSVEFGTGPRAILDSSSKSVNENSTQDEIEKWNKENPSVKMGDPSLYGIRCTERGNCPPGYECCCPAGCDQDCFCIPNSIECNNSPCSSANRFNSNCCEEYGSCCYTDSDGRLRCIDNISNEECIAKTELGGLNGTFNKDTTCSLGPCKTSVTTGACFYTDKLVGHQICRQTTNDTCAGFSGEFFADQECSEFNDKITTGYETITSLVNTKPLLPGDRSCGRFGFSVNCCTEEKNQETGVVTRTCETKCIADCDIGKNGTARIVSDCGSCDQLGHCCNDESYCSSRVTKEDCTGTWYPGEECDEESCMTSIGLRSVGPGSVGGNDGDPVDTGTCSCTGLAGPLKNACTGPGYKAPNVAGHYAPVGLDGVKPLGCALKYSEALVPCISRHVQVTKMGFRHVVFSSRVNMESKCPNAGSGQCNPQDSPPANSITCCGQAANSSWCYDVQTACGDSPSGLGSSSRQRPIHEKFDSAVATFYPYKVRCQQVQDSAGFWRCQVLSEYLYPSDITDYSYGIAGVSDWKTCNNVIKVPLSGDNDCDCDRYYDPFYCVMRESGTCPDDPDPGDTTYIGANLEGPCCSKNEPKFFGDRDINGGAFCPSMYKAGRARAYSIPFRNDQTEGDTQHLYAPSYGVGYIPGVHCLTTGAELPLDSKPINVPEGSIFSECADYFNDKILSDLDDYYQEPLPVTELTFTDYGGVDEDDIAENVCADDLGSGGLASYFKDAKAEYVDATFGNEDNPGDFWIKKEFPQLGYIRLFGVGCYNFPGTFEGGEANELTGTDGVTARAGGNFAGTMVMSFNTKEEFDRYDSVYGSENLKLKFINKVEGQPTDFPIGGDGRSYTFVAQPSYNIRIESDFSSCATQPDTSADCFWDNANDGDPIENGGGIPQTQACSYGQTGYLNGIGLRYADLLNGTDVNNPTESDYDDEQPTTEGRWGKVYEFCSFIAPNSFKLEPPFTVGSNNNDSGGQLKPVFELSQVIGPNSIPKFSGLRGPLVLLDTKKFTVDLSRFDKLIENPFCGTCYTESGVLATGYCTDSDGNRTTATTDWQCLGLPDPDTPTGACCDGTDCTVTTEANCTAPGQWQGEGTNCGPIQGNTNICGGGGIGLPPAGNGNSWTDVAPSAFTQEICEAPNLGGRPTSTYTWYPSVAGITNGGAYGCCKHLPTDPIGTDDDFDCSGQLEDECFPYTPCNTWQDRNTVIHTNPARTFGAGECWSGDGCN